MRNTNKREFGASKNPPCRRVSNILSISKIEDAIVNNVFIDKIYPKLIEFEKITWDEISQQSHQSKGKMKSNNHNVKIYDLSKRAIERLKNLKIEDRDEIYSLRLEGQIRIYGFKELNYLDILWIDLDHSVYTIKFK
jgi:hypothetical protein